MEIPFSGFICLCEKRPESKRHLTFREQLRLESADTVFRVMHSDDCHILTEEGRIFLLYGQLLSGLTIKNIPKLYDTFGTGMGKHLAGFYAILILDSIENRAVVISDKVSSKPVYFTKEDEGWMVSTSFMHLAGHMQKEPALDLTGVAWYLTNGCLHNGHTLFREIIRLERATLYTGDPDRFTPHEFWRFDFTEVPDTGDEKALQGQMLDVMCQAIRECIPLDEDLYLSLSGGYDSSGILAILKYKLGYYNVRTFSYGLKEDIPATDPFHARRLSEIAGTTHDFILSYQSDFQNNIEFNAFWGDGVSNFCDELLCWQQFANAFGKQRPVCFFGDNIFAYGLLLDPQNPAEALESILVKDSGYLPWLEPYLPGTDWDRIRKIMQDECQLLSEKAGRHAGTYADQVSYLVLEARAKVAHVPWRENFCNKAFTSVNPLYHDNCLEFQKKLPLSLREGKKLMRRVVQEIAPAFYEGDRPKYMGYVPDWKQEIRNNYDLIRESYLPATGCYGLDEFIAPATVQKIIDNEIMRQQTAGKRTFLQSIMGRFHQGISKSQGQKKVWPPEKFILRYLVLNRTLELIRYLRG